MTFPVYSTSVQTPRCRRGVKVMQRSQVADRIRSAGVYACRPTAGTNPVKWSPHSKGDAADLMLKVVARVEAMRVGHAAVAQATKRTVANRGRKLRTLVHVVAGTQEWVRGIGWRPYGGIPHDNHVHMGWSFSTLDKPPCAR